MCLVIYPFLQLFLDRQPLQVNRTVIIKYWHVVNNRMFQKRTTECWFIDVIDSCEQISVIGYALNVAALSILDNLCSVGY